MKLIRYADDFVILVGGPRQEAEALFGEAATVLAPTGLSLSEEKTHLTHGASSAEPSKDAAGPRERTTPIP